MALFDSLLLDPAPFEVWIAMRTDGIGGSGTVNDPWDGSTTARLDSILSQLPASTSMTVHLGPGIFTTKGYTDEPTVTPGWEIKAGLKIVGSGTGVTTLKLDTASPSVAAQFFAVGHRLVTGAPTVFNPMDLCEVSDMTIDCNLGAHSSNVAAGAVRLMGNHVRVRRVKVVNWGTKTTSKPCFVVQVIAAHTDPTAGRIELENVGIEECIAMTPNQIVTGGKATVFHAGGQEDAALQMEAYGLAPVIRDCFVDGAIPVGDPLSADIRALSMGWCRAGTVEGNQIHNVQIGGPYQDKATTREIVVRGNSYKNVIRGPWWKLGALGSSIGISLITPVGATPSTLVEATTSSAHNLLKGERVRISGASQGPMNGVFVVTEVPTTTTLRFVLESGVSSSSGAATLQKVYGASNILVEKNVIELATTGTAPAIQVEDGAVGAALGTAQGADFTHTEAIVRGNQIRYLNGQLESGYLGYGIEIAGVKDVIVRDQLLELTPANPIRDLRCRNVTYFNNKTPAGVLVQGYNGLANTKYGELETEGEDAMILALV